MPKKSHRALKGSDTLDSSKSFSWLYTQSWNIYVNHDYGVMLQFYNQLGWTHSARDTHQMYSVITEES